LQVPGGSGFTAESMEEAVALIEAGRVNTEALRGEVFTLDGIEEAMALLARQVTDRDAVRVGIRHTHEDVHR